MVLLSQVKASNARMASTLPNLVAVFSGATAGIGELTMKAFARHATKPKIYFVGRSDEAGTRLKQELKALNPGGEYIFLQAEMSLMKNVDAVCEKIKEKETAINLLVMSQGTLRMGGVTPEGLPYIIAVSYLSRMRMATNLLPLISAASPLRRVVSIHTGAKEGKLYPNDIMARKDVPRTSGRGHLATVNTLSLEALAKQAPNVSFIHNFPGAIDTNLIRSDDGMMLQVLKWGFKFSMRNKFMDKEECGERHAFLCTSAMYPSSTAKGVVDGVPLEDGLQIVRGSDGVKASGTYTLDEFGEVSPEEVITLLAKYRSEGMVDHIMGKVEDEYKIIFGAAK